MAGRKQQNSPVGSPSEDTETGGNALDNASFKDQDRFLPIANVSRIMKKALPTNAKISKEAKETVQECVSEFISFITGEASDKCQREKRKTINGEDLLWAMTTLGFENYVGPLKTHLSKYRDTEEEKNSMARQGDQSPTDVSVTDNISVSTKAAITSTTTVSHHHRHQSIHGDMNFPGINNGFLSLGPLGIQSSFGDQVVYGENSNRNGGFYMSTSYDNGDNKNTNNQNGILWY